MQCVGDAVNDRQQAGQVLRGAVREDDGILPPPKAACVNCLMTHVIKPCRAVSPVSVTCCAVG
jgi:hypothetical protein